MRFDTDRITNADHVEVARATMAVITALQEHAKPVQPLALAAAFRLLADRFRLNPQDLFTYSDNLMRHSDGTRRAEFHAVSDYLANEL